MSAAAPGRGGHTALDFYNGGTSTARWLAGERNFPQTESVAGLSACTAGRAPASACVQVRELVAKKLPVVCSFGNGEPAFVTSLKARAWGVAVAVAVAGVKGVAGSVVGGTGP